MALPSARCERNNKTYNTRGHMQRQTLAYLCASLAALRYSRACRNFEIPDLQTSPSFISQALLDVSSGAPHEEKVSPANFLSDNCQIIICDHVSEFVHHLTGSIQLVIALSLLCQRKLLSGIQKRGRNRRFVVIGVPSDGRHR